MLFYIVNLLVLAGYGYACKVYKKEQMFMIIATMHFSLLIGLRSVHTGSDTYGYWYTYGLILKFRGSVSELLAQWSKYPGWAFFFYGLSRILPKNPDFYMLITGIFIGIGFTVAVRKVGYCKILPYIIFFLICITQSMNGTRQYMAMILIMIAYAFAYKKQYIGAILITLCAILIHSSAAVAVPIICLTFIRWNRRRYLLAVIGICLAIASVELLISYFTQFFAGYDAIGYTLRGSETAMGRHIVLYIINILTIAYAYWIIQHRKPSEEVEQYLWQMIIISSVAIVVGVVFARVRLLGRCVEFYEIFETIFIPYVIRYRNKYRQIYLFLIFGVCTAYFLFWVAGNYGHILPYRTFIV